MPCSCCGDFTVLTYPMKFKTTKKTKKFDICLECELKTIRNCARYIGITTCPKKGAAYILDDYKASDVDHLLEELDNIGEDLRIDLMMFRNLIK